ncbi:MAG: DinB family protein [Gemmatimonadetes bacterium]|nr:DinB family protein [Gemmatimonadota bacterium]
MADTAVGMIIALEQFKGAFEQETATTLKLLKAYPATASELKPNPVLKNARELAFIFATELGVVTAVLRNEFRLPPELPPTPGRWADVVAAFEKSVADLRKQLAAATDEDFYSTVEFFTGPKQVGQVPKVQIAWLMLCDQIHHRGQFSVYMRLAGAKVPSIYGPSADEPWM